MMCPNTNIGRLGPLKDFRRKQVNIDILRFYDKVAIVIVVSMTVCMEGRLYGFVEAKSM